MLCAICYSIWRSGDVEGCGELVGFVSWVRLGTCCASKVVLQRRWSLTQDVRLGAAVLRNAGASVRARSADRWPTGRHPFFRRMTWGSLGMVWGTGATSLERMHRSPFARVPRLSRCMLVCRVCPGLVLKIADHSHCHTKGVDARERTLWREIDVRSRRRHMSIARSARVATKEVLHQPRQPRASPDAP